METILNLAWVLLAVAIVRLWQSHAPREGSCRMRQVAALAMLIVILFPVISVTDDLQAAQNLAEDDVYLRRDLTGGGCHSVAPLMAAVAERVWAEPSFVYLRLHAPEQLTAPTVENPALSAIQNRPPPTA